MARKSNRSSSRRGRQRRRQRPPLRPPVPQPAPLSGDEAGSAAAEEPARERPPAPVSPSRPRNAAARGQLAGPSRLSERAIAEYHYVQRDLRNIGVLMVIMAITLAAAAVIVNVLGIGQV